MAGVQSSGESHPRCRRTGVRRRLPRRSPGRGAAGGPEAAGELPKLLQKSPGAAVWQVAAPTMSIGLLRTLYGLTDAFWLGRCGPTELDAIGASSFAVWVILIVSELGALGVHGVAASAAGSGRRDLVGDAVVQGLYAGLLVSVLMTATWPLVPRYFGALGIPAGSAVAAAGTGYLQVSLLGTFPLAAAAATAAGFKALGEMRPALLITVGTVVLNAVIDPLLIHGFAGVPSLGARGAAHASNFAALCAAVLSLQALRRRGISLKPCLPNWRALRRLASIGAPMTASGLLFSAVYVGMGRIVHRYGGEGALGALGIGHRLESLAFVVCEGFAAGTATVVGQWLGRGEVKPARRAASEAASTAAKAMLPFAALGMICPAVLVRIFVAEPAVVAASASYLRWASLVLPLLAIELVYEGAMTGAQNTWPTLLIGLFLNTARFPAAVALAGLGLGLHGIWMAIAISSVLKGLAKWLAFRYMRLEVTVCDASNDSTCAV